MPRRKSCKVTARAGEIGAGEGKSNPRIQLGSRTLLQDFLRRFRRIAAKQPYRLQTTISRCRNAFETFAAKVAGVAYHIEADIWRTVEKLCVEDEALVSNATFLGARLHRLATESVTEEI